jgi:heme/copper-type cytochrome/quinol oxidase subunit 3
VGQIFCGVLTLFGILIAVIGILVGLYADAPGGGSVEAHLLWGLIFSTTLAIVLSSITAGCSLARTAGYDVSLGTIQGMMYLVLFLVTTCVVVVAVAALRYA